jgi:hypothetical protein
LFATSTISVKLGSPGTSPQCHLEGEATAGTGRASPYGRPNQHAAGSAGIEACIQIIATYSREGSSSWNASLSLPFFLRGDGNMPFIFIMWAVPTIIVLGGISYYLLRAVQ